MHEIDLSQYDLRTDLIIEDDISNIKKNSYNKNNIFVDDIILGNNNQLKRKKGKYVTITYSDLTDSINFINVLKIFQRELRLNQSLKKLKKLEVKLSQSLVN